MSNNLMINEASDATAVFGAALVVRSTFVVNAAFIVNAAPKHRQLSGTGLSDGGTDRARRPPEIPL
jgi:hypothetical protein